MSKGERKAPAIYFGHGRAQSQPCEKKTGAAQNGGVSQFLELDKSAKQWNP